MKVRAFVIISSLSLFGWLTATFVRVVPMHTYDPNLLRLNAGTEDGEPVLDQPLATTAGAPAPVATR